MWYSTFTNQRIAQVVKDKFAEGSTPHVCDVVACVLEAVTQEELLAAARASLPPPSTEQTH